MTGYAAGRLDSSGQAAADALLSADDESRLVAHFQQMSQAADSALLPLEYQIRLADGRARWILSRDQVFLRDERGQARQILCITQDITERKETAAALLRAKEAAEAADGAKTTFLAHMSHEIRTPLTAIIGMASLLAESPLSPAQRESVAIIRTGGEILLSLIGNVLDFSKIEAGQFDLATRPFDLPATCQAAINLVRQAASHKGLSINLRIDPSVPSAVIGDDGRLRQVLLNLLSNAVKFTASGSVSLHVRQQEAGGRMQDEGDLPPASCLLFEVSDTGTGIAREQLDQIFQPFVQIQHGQRLPESGTGLGLAISRQLVRLMGGQIEVESTLGVGTTFTLTLPLKLAEAPLDQVAPGVLPLPSAALRVLIVEDNPINQEVLQRMLYQLGVSSTVVGDGAAALAAVRAVVYDLVLMDIQMPVMDGEEATRQIRAQGATIAQPHIIALTASALLGDRERYLAAGMDEYLSKPVQLEDLQRVLAARGYAAADLVAAPAVPATELIDWPAIERLIASFEMPQAQAWALVHRLCDRELGAQIDTIVAAAGAEDRPAVARLAHKLLGGSRQLGASAIAALCIVLEAAAQQPDAPPLDQALAQLRTAYEQTRTQLRERIASQGVRRHPGL